MDLIYCYDFLNLFLIVDEFYLLAYIYYDIQVVDNDVDEYSNEIRKN